MSSKSIIVATTNAGKVREMQALLADLPVVFTTLADHPSWPEPVEDAETFEGNATLKAIHYARHSGGWVLAEDSGLEVDALGLEPGVRSARYAGSDRDDSTNNAKLIKNLAGVPTERRTARYRCAIVLAGPEGVLATTTGTVEGLIVDEPRGSNGFGYDPHFYVPSEGMTTAQMPPDRKNAISHRGQALRRMLPAIERLVSADRSIRPGP